MNIAIIIGRITKDPELRYTPNQLAVCAFTIAVDRPGKAGEDKGTDFIRCKAFGKTAESMEKFMSKGRQIAINGRIQTGSYDDKDGKKVYTTEVIANQIKFLEKNAATSAANVKAEQREEDMAAQFAALEEEIPF